MRSKTLAEKVADLRVGDTFTFLANATIPADLFERPDFQVNHLYVDGAIEFIKVEVAK